MVFWPVAMVHDGACKGLLLHDTQPLGFMKGGKFLEYILKKDSDP